MRRIGRICANVLGFFCTYVFKSHATFCPFWSPQGVVYLCYLTGLLKEDVPLIRLQLTGNPIARAAPEAGAGAGPF